MRDAATQRIVDAGRSAHASGPWEADTVIAADSATAVTNPRCLITPATGRCWHHSEVILHRVRLDHDTSDGQYIVNYGVYGTCV